MHIQKVYEKYKIMPSLQLHMYRVAAVSKILCEYVRPANKELIISACLLHDMGNILKFDLNLFPEFLAPQGLEYWQKVKDQYEAKYGTNEHEATVKIAHELKVKAITIGLIDAILFEKAAENYKSGDLDKMICQYSDMRVAPFGIKSLKDRLEDGRRRFILRNNTTGDDEAYEQMVKALQQMEEIIFSNIDLKPEDITDQIVTNELATLRQFELK